MTTCVPPFYLNVLLLNKEALVSAKVTEKTGTGIFGKAAASLANRIVSDDMVLYNVAEILTEKITVAVEAMGIACNVVKRMQVGCLVCFRVTITAIDQLELVLKVKGPEYAAAFSRLLATLSELGLAETALPTIDSKIAEKVLDGLKSKFQDLIPLKMKEQGLVVETRACAAEEQADIFFDMADRANSGEP